MDMIELGYVFASALIAMIVVARGYPLAQPIVQKWRAEGRLGIGRAARAVTQEASV
jgi:hypothetical protein